MDRREAYRCTVLDLSEMQPTPTELAYHIERATEDVARAISALDAAKARLIRAIRAAQDAERFDWLALRHADLRSEAR